jgi:hypothetical protein
MLRLLVNLSVASLMISFSSSAMGTDKCISIPSEDPILRSCTLDNKLIIEGEGYRYIYDYPAYSESLSNQIKEWFELNQISPTLYCNETAEIILSVPELNPHNFALRVQFKLGDKTFMFAAPGQPKLWNHDSFAGKVFEKGESYPSSYGFAAGALVAKLSKEANPDDVESFLEQFGASPASNISNKWLNIKVPILSEIETLNEMKQNTNFYNLFTSVTINTSYEWMSYKGKIKAFKITCN